MFARNEPDEQKIDNFVERLINNSSAAKSNNVDVDLVEGQKLGSKLRFDATWVQCYKIILRVISGRALDSDTSWV